MADLRGESAVAARALEFLILTNVRTDAVLKATWDQFDLDPAVWTVPLANLKDREHRTEGFRVPLSPRAVEIVREMEKVRLSRFVFPGRARASPLEYGAADAPEAHELGAKKWLDKRPADHGPRFSGDLQDVGGGSRDRPARCSRTGDGPSGRHPGRARLPPDGPPREAPGAHGHLGAPLRGPHG